MKAIASFHNFAKASELIREWWRERDRDRDRVAVGTEVDRPVKG